MLIPYMTHLFCSGCRWTMCQQSDSLRMEDGAYKAIAACSNPACPNHGKKFLFNVPVVNGVEIV